MRAMVLDTYGGPGAVRLTDLPEPESSGRILVDVHAAGVSFADVLMTRGRYQMKPPLPFVPGMEVAGLVRSAPPETGLGPGDRVAAFVFTGGFAEVAACPASLTFRVPAAFDLVTAAGLVLNYHTAWFALARRGRLVPGETVLVHGAAGGVGTATVQVARALGARVGAVVGDGTRAAVAREAGAEWVVVASPGWEAEVRDRTGGRGVDVVVDPVGGQRTDESLRCLALEGRLVVVGFAGGEIAAIRVNRLLLRNVEVVGSAWREFAEAVPAAGREIGAEVGALAEAGAIRPLVGRTYPLEAGAEALDDLERRRAVGKSVLLVRGRNR